MNEYYDQTTKDYRKDLIHKSKNKDGNLSKSKIK
jgi:hypothetical protein